VKDDLMFKKYFKLISMGMPQEQVALKMKADGLDASVLEKPEGVSPNDPGVYHVYDYGYIYIYIYRHASVYIVHVA
jgi:hypothetical protein